MIISHRRLFPKISLGRIMSHASGKERKHIQTKIRGYNLPYPFGFKGFVQKT